MPKRKERRNGPSQDTSAGEDSGIAASDGSNPFGNVSVKLTLLIIILIIFIVSFDIFFCSFRKSNRYGLTKKKLVKV